MRNTQSRTRAAIEARPISPRIALNRNGHITLYLALTLALFTAAALVGAGGQFTELTAWLAGSVLFLAGTSLLCFTLAYRRGRGPVVARYQRPAQVTHPRVSHPLTHPSPDLS
jgi:hypothetical protein